DDFGGDDPQGIGVFTEEVFENERRVFGVAFLDEYRDADHDVVDERHLLGAVAFSADEKVCRVPLGLEVQNRLVGSFKFIFLSVIELPVLCVVEGSLGISLGRASGRKTVTEYLDYGAD